GIGSNTSENRSKKLRAKCEIAERIALLRGEQPVQQMKQWPHWTIRAMLSEPKRRAGSTDALYRRRLACVVTPRRARKAAFFLLRPAYTRPLVQLLRLILQKENCRYGSQARSYLLSLGENGHAGAAGTAGLCGAAERGEKWETRRDGRSGS